MPRGFKLTQEEFILKAKDLHSDRYDYSQTKFINTSKKIIIICKVHGKFLQHPSSHLRGSGCKKCYYDKVKFSKSEKFLDKCPLFKNPKYDFSEVKYINSKTKIKIKCKTHGYFYQRPSQSLAGVGCPQCSYSCRTKSKDQFLKEINEKHKNLYNYNLTNYKNNTSRIEIFCQIHGKFIQIALAHLQGNGCPHCKQSKGEKRVEKVLETFGINFVRQYKNELCKNKRTLSFDFAVLKESLIILIEYQGQYHYHIRDDLEKAKKLYNRIQLHDKIKKDFCEANNIPLLCIHYQDFDRIEELVYQFLQENGVL